MREGDKIALMVIGTAIVITVTYVHFLKLTKGGKIGPGKKFRKIDHSGDVEEAKKMLKDLEDEKKLVNNK